MQLNIVEDNKIVQILKIAQLQNLENCIHTVIDYWTMEKPGSKYVVVKGSLVMKV